MVVPISYAATGTFTTKKNKKESSLHKIRAKGVLREEISIESGRILNVRIMLFPGFISRLLYRFNINILSGNKTVTLDF